MPSTIVANRASIGAKKLVGVVGSVLTCTDATGIQAVPVSLKTEITPEIAEHEEMTKVLIGASAVKSADAEGSAEGPAETGSAATAEASPTAEGATGEESAEDPMKSLSGLFGGNMTMDQLLNMIMNSRQPTLTDAATSEMLITQAILYDHANVIANKLNENNQFKRPFVVEGDETLGSDYLEACKEVSKAVSEKEDVAAVAKKVEVAQDLGLKRLEDISAEHNKLSLMDQLKGFLRREQLMDQLRLLQTATKEKMQSVINTYGSVADEEKQLLRKFRLYRDLQERFDAEENARADEEAEEEHTHTNTTASGEVEDLENSASESTDSLSSSSYISTTMSSESESDSQQATTTEEATETVEA